eukprot:4964087-Amphidinium_carterae.1
MAGVDFNRHLAGAPGAILTGFWGQMAWKCGLEASVVSVVGRRLTWCRQEAELEQEGLFA